MGEGIVSKEDIIDGH